MSEPRKRHAGLLFAAAAAALLLLPCVYVGSIGPVVRWLDNPRLMHFWMVFYAPLEWAHDHTPLRKPLEAYVALWMDLVPGPGD